MMNGAHIVFDKIASSQWRLSANDATALTVPVPPDVANRDNSGPHGRHPKIPIRAGGVTKAGDMCCTCTGKAWMSLRSNFAD
jgi:hypothetical protein